MPSLSRGLTRSGLFVAKCYAQLLFHDEARYSCISPTSPQTQPLAWMLDEVKKVVKSVLRNEKVPMLPTQLRGYFRDLLAPLLEVSISLPSCIHPAGPVASMVAIRIHRYDTIEPNTVIIADQR